MQNVINLPTAKTINYRANAPFRAIARKFEVTRKIFLALIISNFLCWILLIATVAALITHDHSVNEYVQSIELAKLPPIEEVQ